MHIGKNIFSVLLVSMSLLLSVSTLQAEHPDKKMTNQRLAELIKKIDADVQGRPGNWEFLIEGRQVRVITDEKANRMRIIVPVAPADKIDKERLIRMMQANFDSALDARYAIAKGILWAAFIHPLAPLQDNEFLAGVGQTVNLAITYGEGYSSGALVFGDGDSSGLRRRELIDELLRKGLSI